ncbi:MAG: ATP-binding cassette domain-containing protein, partial [Mucispirillum sp.]|nr:ATP-binding cassette domain-containing protein [Mucispirillum sp.]
ILGLEKATEGTVLFMGKNIHSLKYNELKNIYKDMQVVFQDPQSSMNPQFTVYDVIKEPVENYYNYKTDEVKDIVLNLLSAVKLSEDKMYKNIMHLSGGEQQRVSVARALSVHPKLLILDEALSSLDMIIQAEIIRLLEELKEKYKLSYLVISHDIRIILKLCDDIIFLENGIIKDKFSIEQGINNPSESFKNMMII